MRVGFGTGRTLSSEKRIRAPIASSDDCLVAHVINRGLSPIVQPARGIAITQEVARRWYARKDDVND